MLSTCPDRPRELSPFLRRLIVSALLIGLPAIILSGAWRLGGASAIEDDLIYYLPIRQFIGQQIRSGEFPLWNPFTCMGASIAADPQSGLWYPPTWLFVILPPLVAYPLTIILHFALAGGGMYRFLRSLRRDWRAALLGAIAFEFCGYLIAHRAHLTIHHATAWLPWMFLGWQRFTQTGRYRFFALAVGSFGIQMLVQHIQISIITCTLLTAYAAFLLWPHRRALLWQYPVGMTIGAAIGAIVTLPAFFQFASSGRSMSAYSLFVENSWMPTSSVMFLFPMFFGSRTPNFWADPWWGLSHFCEQSAYTSIPILALAVTSLALLRRRADSHTGGRPSRMNDNREVLFWWAACFVALVLALGQFTPLAKWLFHVPVYRNLRVPARWILVWSTAMPVLASAVVSSVLRQDARAPHVARWLRRVSVYVLPAAAVILLTGIVVARWNIFALEEAFRDRYQAAAFFDGFKAAVRPGNIALWWPILLLILSGTAVSSWCSHPAGRQTILLFNVLLIDLASIAVFVDVDINTYHRRDLTSPSPLAEAITSRSPLPGHRLLVPRLEADYDHPLEILWPQTNLQHGIPTLNGYGPFWPVANRMLFRFMPWGSSENMLHLLRNPVLLRQMGVRFLACRSKHERALLLAAQWPPVAARPTPIPGTDSWTPVRYGQDVCWPVNLERQGLYELAFEAKPVQGSASRWFVSLESPDGKRLDRTQTLSPQDLSSGSQKLRFMFRVSDAVGAARIRVQAEIGYALNIADATFGCVAASGEADPSIPIEHIRDLTDGTSLFELRGPRPLVSWAGPIEAVSNLEAAVTRLQSLPLQTTPESTVLVEWAHQGIPLPTSGSGDLICHRDAMNDLSVRTDSPTSGLLVLNETYDPGWTASIDGRVARICRVNAICQGVAVPAGTHTVRFHYRPPGLRIGTVISLFALLLLFIVPLYRNLVRFRS